MHPDEHLAAVIAAEAAGRQTEFLFFWGHRPQTDGTTGPGCLSQWWPASFTVEAWSTQQPSTGCGRPSGPVTRRVCVTSSAAGRSDGRPGTPRTTPTSPERCCSPIWRCGDPRKSGAGQGQAGNGSLMRCIPTALAVPDRTRRIRESAEISAITHDDQRAVAACAAYNEIAAALITGTPPAEAIASGLACARQLGCAPVAGGLLGARDGASAIPQRWRAPLQYGAEFTEAAAALARRTC